MSRCPRWTALAGLCGVLGAAAAFAANEGNAPALPGLRGLNHRGDLLIADQFNNRVILVNPAGMVVAPYGLPLAGGGAIGNNVGYNLHTTQKGLYSPYDAKVIGDYTGLTPPFDADHDADN